MRRLLLLLGFIVRDWRAIMVLMVTILANKAVHILWFEPAVASGTQAIGAEQSSICPLSYCVGMNMQKPGHLSGG
jgi:uncharacterized membrane protein YphA (DoxX/SURF4 family)